MTSVNVLLDTPTELEQLERIAESREAAAIWIATLDRITKRNEEKTNG